MCTKRKPQNLPPIIDIYLSCKQVHLFTYLFRTFFIWYRFLNTYTQFDLFTFLFRVESSWTFQIWSRCILTCTKSDLFTCFFRVKSCHYILYYHWCIWYTLKWRWKKYVSIDFLFASLKEHPHFNRYDLNIFGLPEYSME